MLGGVTSQDEIRVRGHPLSSGSPSRLAKGRHKTETISLRIDSKLKLLLSQEAKKRRINLNALASQIFTGYIDWWRYSEELHLVPFNNEVLKEIFQSLNRESIDNVARKAGELTAREEIMFLFNRIDLDTLLRYIEIRSAHFSAYHHWMEGGMHHFTLQHDLGINFSLFSKGYIASMIRGTIGGSVDFLDVSPNSITYRITA